MHNDSDQIAMIPFSPPIVGLISDKCRLGVTRHYIDFAVLSCSDEFLFELWLTNQSLALFEVP